MLKWSNIDVVEYLSLGKEAKILGVTPRTWRRPKIARTIRSERTPTGYRRYRPAEILRLRGKRQVGSDLYSDVVYKTIP